MAKVLLINSNRFKHPWPVIPFGLLYIASSLESNGDTVKVLDLCFSHDCKKDIKRTIQEFFPDVIGISIRNIDDTGGYKVHFLLSDVKRNVTDYCKQEFSGPIVIGGPAVGISGPEMLEYFDLEYAIRGDGELVLKEFVNRIKKGLPPDGLMGLIIRRQKMIIQENEPFREDNLDAIPFPRPEKYLNISRYRRYGSPIHIQTKRGCNLKCSYCTYNTIEGKDYRLRKPSFVADEIELLVKNTGFTRVEFTDSIFNIPLYHAKEVLKEIIKKNLNLTFHTMGLSPAAVDEELISLMKTAGFNEVDVGAESLSDEVLQSLGKCFRRSEVIKTAEILKKAKLPVTWFIMLGAIAESNESVHETLKSIGEIASADDLVFISTGIRIYKGAPIADELLKIGIYPGTDKYLFPVKIEPEKISLSNINSISRQYSFRYPNFYFYNKEKIIPGWLLISGNILLKIFNSHQPVWHLLILLKRFEKLSGFASLKNFFRTHKRNSITDNYKGFSVVTYKKTICKK